MRRRKIILRRETVRVLASPDLTRAAGGLPIASDEAGPCAPTMSWCTYDCQTVRPQLTCWLDP
jgi:hypothetical protein